jgi:hypothetical protein
MPLIAPVRTLLPPRNDDEGVAMYTTKDQRKEFVANWYRAIGTWQKDVRRAK